MIMYHYEQPDMNIIQAAFIFCTTFEFCIVFDNSKQYLESVQAI